MSVFTKLGALRRLSGGMILLLIASSDVVAAPEKSRYSFGVVPQQTAVRMSRAWVPMMRYVTEQSGVELYFGTAKNIPTFEVALAAGRYDFSYMSPYHYTSNSVDSQHATGYRAFARARDKHIQGIIVVRKDSPVRSLNKLNGLRLAFPSEGAFGASRVPRAELARHGVFYTPIYVASHDSVYLNVVAGKAEAGAGVLRTLNLMAPEVRRQLRILHTTKAYTPHAIAAHSRVPAEVVARVRDALVLLEQQPKGREILGLLGLEGFVAANDHDWDDVRRDFPAPERQ